MKNKSSLILLFAILVCFFIPRTLSYLQDNLGGPLGTIVTLLIFVVPAIIIRVIYQKRKQ